MGSSTIRSETRAELKRYGEMSGYPKDWLRQAEKATGDDLIERGVELSWRTRLRRWWFGWGQAK